MDYINKTIEMLKPLLNVLNISVIYNDDKQELLAKYPLIDVSKNQIEEILNLILNLASEFEAKDSEIEDLRDRLYSLEDPDYYDN